MPAGGERASVTQFVEETEGGRERGPVGLLRAWIGVLVRPRRFFATRLEPADQAPGLVFAALVVLIEEATRIALVPGAVPVFRNQPVASTILWLLVAVVLVAPAAIHLTAAAQTLVLVATAPERAGVSRTVQVICYATAPAVLAGAPEPFLRAPAAAYGAVLLVVGTAEVHDVSLPGALLAAAVPAWVIFAYGFGGFEATVTVAELTWDWLEATLG